MFLRCMPFHADPQPNPNDSHPTVRSCVHSFASRPSNGATGCTTVHLPLLFACRHTYTTSTTVPLLYQQHRKRLLTTGQPSATGYHTVYEKCPTRRGKRGTPSFLNLLNHSRPPRGRTVILGAVLRRIIGGPITGDILMPGKNVKRYIKLCAVDTTWASELNLF